MEGLDLSILYAVFYISFSSFSSPSSSLCHFNMHWHAGLPAMHVFSNMYLEKQHVYVVLGELGGKGEEEEEGGEEQEKEPFIFISFFIFLFGKELSKTGRHVHLLLHKQDRRHVILSILSVFMGLERRADVAVYLFLRGLPTGSQP